MKDGTQDEARLVEYLLGQGDAASHADIEERYASDPAFLDELQAVERDLIDQYVRGELANRAAFERHFLASPARREKVAFARALMQSNFGAANRRAPYLRWPLAAAAALVLSAGLWLLLAGRQTPDSERAGLQTPAAPVTPSGTAIPRPPPDTLPRVVTLMLAPTATREAGGPPVLDIGAAAEVRLQLSLESAGYRSYRAVIRTANGAEILRQDRLTAQADPRGPTITMTFPANRLATDDYTIALTGVLPSGDVEELSGYYFRARR
jgi:hypothetical protein